MTPPISLRPTSHEDRHLLFDIHKAAMGPLIEELFGPWDDDTQWAYFDRWHRLEDTYVVQVEDADVGLIGLERRSAEVYVTRIEVHPDWQNRGIGTAVLRRVIDEAAQQGRSVSLHVFKANPAQRLYRRLGFVILGEDRGRHYMSTNPYTRGHGPPQARA